MQYRLPAQDVAVVRVELYYDLMLPTLKAMDGIPPDLKQAKVIARAERLVAAP